MRNRWTTWLATSALVLLVGSGITAFRADAADAAKKDFPFPGRGLAGWEIVSPPSARVANLTQRTAQCPPGKKATGGGANVSGDDQVLLGSFPTADGRGWVGLGRSSAGAVDIVVYAVCARVS